MKGNKTSKNEKHEHTVIVCSIIGKKGNNPKPNRDKENELISDLRERNLSLPNNSITDKIREPLNFVKIHDNYLSDNYYEIREERKRKKDRDNKIDSYPILGEYLKHYKRIILYINNIEDYCKKKNQGSIDKVEKEKLIITTYIHELFHAYFHFVTEQSIFRQYRYNYILEIEEAITEFCTLVYINYVKSGGLDWKDILKFAHTNISEKQESKGDLSAYGFGAYLFDNMKKENERFELINNYIQKLGNINENDKKVNEYIEKVREPKNYEECVKLLKEILEPTAK